MIDLSHLVPYNERLLDLLVPDDGVEDRALWRRRMSMLLFSLFQVLIWVPLFSLFFLVVCDSWLLFGLSLSSAVLALGSLPLAKAGAMDLAGHWLTATVFYCLVMFSWFTGGISSPSMVWFVCVPLMGWIFVDRGSGLSWLVLSVAVITGFWAAEDLGGLAFASLLDEMSHQYLLTLNVLGLLGALLASSLQHNYLQNFLMRQIQQDRDDLNALFASAPDAVFAVDGAGRVERCSGSAGRVFGWSAELVGRRLCELIPTLHARTLADVHETLGAVEDCIGVRSDGTEFPLAVSIQRYGASAGDRFVVIARDVTHERQLKRRLSQSQEMEALGRVAGGVAHDFNNFLSIISGHAEFLRTAVQGNPQAVEDLQVVTEATGRGASLVDQMLMLSRGDDGAPEVIDLSETVARTGSMLRRVLGSDIELRVDTSSKPCTALARRARIEQALLNAALHARDVMSGDGELSLGTRRQCVDGAPYATVEISHTHRESDITLFRQAFAPLSPASSSAEDEGDVLRDDALRIERHENGTTAILRFPLEDPAASPERRPATERSKVTVLIIDDEPALRRVARRILESRDIDVLTAEDGQSAVNIAHSCDCHIDLILSDIVMPGMSGIDAVEQIRKHHPEVPVIFSSGYTRDAEERLDRVERSRFLQKPYPPSRLLELVEDMSRSPCFP